LHHLPDKRFKNIKKPFKFFLKGFFMDELYQMPFTIICKVYTAVFAVINSTSLFFPLKQTLAVGSEGVVVVAGVLSGINTSGFGNPATLAGEILYVGSGGGLSTTQSGGAVGVIAKKAVEGVIIVEAKGNGTWGALKAGLA
jgi:hypothetical protein